LAILWHPFPLNMTMTMKINLLAFTTGLLLLGGSAYAQNEFYNKGADIYIQQGALVHVQGELVNTENTADIRNDGVIEVKGDFTSGDGNSAKLRTLTGTSTEAVVKFVGNGSQAIKGTLNNPGADQSFYNLLVDKGTSGTAVQLRGDVEVTGSLVFGSATTAATYTPSAVSQLTNNGNKGVISTYNGTTDYEIYVSNGDSLAVGGYAALAMSNGTADSYIQTRGEKGVGLGGFSRSVTGTDGSYVFPVGTVANGYNPTILNFYTVGSGPNKIRSLFCDGTSNVNGQVGVISPSCPGGCAGGLTPDNNGYNRYFATNPCNGGDPQWIIIEDAVIDHGFWSFEGDNTNVYAIETFPNSYTAQGNISADTWRTLKYPAAIGVDPSGSGNDWGGYIENVVSLYDLITYSKNGGCYAGDGIPGGRYTGFSHFAVKSSKTNNALPVELIYLKAEPVQNSFIKISWATALEIDNDGFEVLRSEDGVNFTNIGWVNGHDNSTIINSYFIDDHNVAPNVVYYYKLNQIDNDGDNEETYIVSAMINNGPSFTISEFIPNPTSGGAKLVVNSSAAQNVTVKFYDLLGRELNAYSFELTAGQNTLNFETQVLADATYTAVINADDKLFTKKLVVQKSN
jgi:hypothetical protein